MSSVDEKIAAGHYNAKVAYPERVREPAILRKSVKDLTIDEINSVAAVKGRYDADKIAYEAARAAWNAEEAEGKDRLRKDLAAEAGLTGHPKEGWVWSKAWEHGHSNGYSNVSYWYDEFADAFRK